MLRNDSLLETRTEYINLMKKELLGPGSEISLPDEEHELITSWPAQRYSLGILFPPGRKNNDENSEEKDDVEQEDENEYLKRDEDFFASFDSTENNPDEWEHHEDDVDEDVENLDSEVVMATQNKPSSMGITFFVKGSTEKIKCHVKFATYRKADSNDCKIPLSEDCVKNMQLPIQFEQYLYIDKEEKTLRLRSGGFNAGTVNELKEKDVLDQDEYQLIEKSYKLAKQLAVGYIREPHEDTFDLDFQGKNYVDNNSNIDETNLKATSLRRRIHGDIYAVTIMLVNEEQKKSPKQYFFQPEIRVLSNENEFLFVDYSGGEDFSVIDDEEKSLALQYRNKKIYATGLGTSAGWNVDENGDGEVFSDFFPMSEIPSMDFELEESYDVAKETFSMKGLSDLNKEGKDTKIKRLKSLVSAYTQWIDETDKKSTSLDSKYQEISRKNINGCKESAKRMERGIEILSENQKAWDAFQLANRAMYMQRVHLKLQDKISDKVRYPDDEELGDLLDNIDYYHAESVFEDKYAWRPFQLAFLIMSIEAIVDDNSSDRRLVDLIWFPTGGGKTEAYLGLTAFTIFYRRLAHKEAADGTTVIMRYTLRLLAAQQFTRASTLICACEYIRVDAISRRPVYGKYDLGKTRITIGLWIGSAHTPNKNADARNYVNKLNRSTSADVENKKEWYNKFQVLKCPWCGTSLVKSNVSGKLKGIFGYQMKNNSHFELFCPQENCFFDSQGSLPIQVVDEELYNNPPTLLFGTVDKFAMLPWNPRIGAFFATQSKNRAPELIIQDELHLISGPLGTMVGLYEAAIDKLCIESGVKTKIIASTATIRRAAEQCYSLYNREVAQFPHPGIDAENSFFAREAEIDHESGKYGRVYVGLMPSEKSKTMMEARTIAGLLHNINTMDLPDEIRDKFWTLTVYFNSIKDLGKSVTLVNDDVKDALFQIACRTWNQNTTRKIGNAEELTSRVSTIRLNETLDKLEKLCFNKENMEQGRWPISVLLATNMISVGIDVARLNVMLMVGQPKLTSEYIQASSRVGRSYPGVVFTMYDASKSRDRSHYEQFKGYHDSFYRFVEPTGVTPFSKPARDRALHAVVISLLRHLIPDLSEEKMAGNFRKKDFKNEIENITNYIIDRCKSITEHINSNMDTDADAEEIKCEIDDILEHWENLTDQEYLYYGEKFIVKSPDDGEGRLLKVFNTSRADRAFETMNSMRNVDTMVASSIIIWGDGENAN